ncbi:IS1 transposase [Holospora undulata]|uniref:Uncharacterized protein n=1 Tax=Holospora undulata HU1 TaxID=1321371 RepID=A0A061JGY8_9PROT|nr:IS1 transposase [Holospora undulata]ETZ05375.1 hypothetical protein K737_300184 [Holospora undulata HU1]
MPEKDKLQAFVLYASGLSMNRIAQRFGVSASAVLKKAGTLGSKLCAKIEPSPEKTKVLSRKSIYDRAGKRIIDWEFGDHYSQAFKRLFERLKFLND